MFSYNWLFHPWFGLGWASFLGTTTSIGLGLIGLDNIRFVIDYDSIGSPPISATSSLYLNSSILLPALQKDDAILKSNLREDLNLEIWEIKENLEFRELRLRTLRVWCKGFEKLSIKVYLFIIKILRERETLSLSQRDPTALKTAVGFGSLESHCGSLGSPCESPMTLKGAVGLSILGRAQWALIFFLTLLSKIGDDVATGQTYFRIAHSGRLRPVYKIINRDINI